MLAVLVLPTAQFAQMVQLAAPACQVIITLEVPALHAQV